MESTDARYIYCIVPMNRDNKEVNSGKIGIENSEVYTVPYQDLCAVVHNCKPEPYKSENDKQVKGWIMAHEKVVETALEKFGNVLPLGFDTIVKGDEKHSAEENLKKWLKKDYENLKKKMEKVKGRAEYGVQISWDPKIISARLIQENKEFKDLEQEIKSKSKGLAYMYRQKLEDMLKKEMEKEADRCFKDFYARINKHCNDIRVEKVKKIKGKQMLMNLSCLAYRNKKNEYQASLLGEELEKINNMVGFEVRFTGPWPPYSFV